MAPDRRTIQRQPPAVQRLPTHCEAQTLLSVKNRSPDISWIGAERINKAGIMKVGAIHRGFSTFERSQLVNKPNEIPTE
jgi:hypothetical protein